jgi:hypothetical protein
VSRKLLDDFDHLAAIISTHESPIEQAAQATKG